MQVSVETTQGLQRKMTIALPAEDINSAVTERLQSLGKTTKMNGFRPGKVPFNVLKKRFEPQVRSEVLGTLINKSFYDAVQQEQLRPAGQPVIAPEDEKDNGADGFSYIATFEVYPEFDPVFNDKINVTRPLVDINDTDIDEMIESLQKQRMDFKAVDRAAANDDQIVIDFNGRVDGEEFEGGQAEKAPLVLGSGAMIEGFESQLIGLSAGGTLDSLKADITKNMERELKQRIDNEVKTQIMDGLLELNPIDIPASLVKEEIDRQKEQMMQQMPADADASFLGDELFTEQAERRVRLGLVVGEIVQKSEIKADAAAVRTQVEAMSSSYQDPQQVISR